jgi:hypothetical protein
VKKNEAVMKTMFPGSFEAGVPEYREHWKDFIFILDTSVFLSLYHKKPEEVSHIIELLDTLSPKIWIPYQVAKVYLDKREYVIAEERQECQKLKEAMEMEITNLKGLVQNSCNPVISGLTEKMKDIERSMRSFQQALLESINGHISSETDEILEQLSDIIVEDRIGAPLSYQCIEAMDKEAQTRAAYMMPPFIHSEETGLKQYSSLIQWKQILQHIKKCRLPAVFITDGHPNDWWKQIDTDLYSVRAELINELNSDLKVFFQITELDQFRKYAEILFEELGKDSHIVDFDSFSRQAK